MKCLILAAIALAGLCLSAQADNLVATQVNGTASPSVIVLPGAGDFIYTTAAPSTQLTLTGNTLSSPIDLAGIEIQADATTTIGQHIIQVPVTINGVTMTAVIDMSIAAPALALQPYVATIAPDQRLFDLGTNGVVELQMQPETVQFSTTASNVVDVRFTVTDQLRWSPPQTPSPVPEPSSFVLLASALIVGVRGVHRPRSN